MKIHTAHHLHRILQCLNQIVYPLQIKSNRDSILPCTTPWFLFTPQNEILDKTLVGDGAGLA